MGHIVNFLIRCLKKLYINQNFLWFIVLLYGIRFISKEQDCCIYVVTFAVFAVVGISVISSTIAYAIHYWTRQIFKSK